MSEPIRKPSDISKAPTPQNTPSSVANLYLKQQPPTVSTISEEDEKNLSKQLANNPALLSMIQGKLGDLVGQQSGYVESLPKSVKKRVSGLKAVQQQQMKLEAEFQKELLELEKAYLKKYEPLYEKRKAIVNGDQEPTAAEIEEGEALKTESDEEDEEEEEEEDEDEDDDVKGIPGFWLTAMENLTFVRETITERDSEVLAYLKDVRMEYLTTLGFELIFEFNENPHFSNQVLTKTYYYHPELGYSGDFVYDHADGCEINWKSKEANVTINIERRKQRNKNTKQTRTIEKLTPTESFFNFFDPPKPPQAPTEVNDDEDEEEDEEEAELRDRLEFDYQLGEEIKNKLIPRAIDWFSGDAVEYEGADDYDDEEEEFDEDEEDDDDDDSDINESGPKENPPDCKQQ
ncbi:hypothetical protein PUMCH_004533 [Australozyma saopauloensis]|uniref:Nucleosome assembly protein n=1 Tax=Australozyma saopauloensis TaxID=291208 RepID=A0AAX4HEW6_9ASCO|nr:hypothetical protein PUMCH_004533 [[Candida] saopauloensis]